MLEPDSAIAILRRFRDLLVLTILCLVALLFSGRHTTTAFSKTTTCYVLIWSALLIEFILVYRRDELDLRPWWPMLACLGVFLLWCTFSAVWVSPIPRSFRELSRWLAIVSLVVICMGAGRSAWFREQVLWFGTLVPLIVSIYACFQSLGYDFFRWPEFEWEREFRRVTGTLGNPDFLAGYLLGTIPLSVAYGLSGAGVWRRAFAGTSVAFQFAAIILTLSRGVWIGLACSVIALAAVTPKKRHALDRLIDIFRPRRRAVLCGLSVLLGMIVGTVVLWPALLNLYVRVTEGSLSGRLQIYSSSLRLAAQNPLIGVGLDAFPVRFPEFRSPELSRYLPFGQWYVEHAHSEPLEVLVDLGGVGLVLWVGIFVFWSRTILMRLRRLDRSRMLLVGAAWVATIGVLGHNLVTVTLRHTSTHVPFWAFVGVAIGASSENGMSKGDLSRFAWRSVVLGLLVIGAPLIWLHATRQHQADRYLRQAYDVINVALQERRHDRKTTSCHYVLDLLAHGDRLAPDRKETLYWRAWAYYELGDYLSARSEYERILEQQGPFVDSVPNLGKVLLRIGADYMATGFRREGLLAYRESLRWWEWACQMEPNRAEHWQNLAGALGMVGRIDEARNAFKRALDLETEAAAQERIRDLMNQLERDAQALQQQAERILGRDTGISTLPAVTEE